MKRKRSLYILMCLFVVAGCGEAPFDPMSAPGGLGKAEGIFDATKRIAYGATEEGAVAGNSIALYTVQIEDHDAFRITVTATSGDLKPSAYLYYGPGTSTFIPPSPFDVADRVVTLDYNAQETGEHYIVVKARSGSGQYRLELECISGPCASGESPVPDHPNAIASRCLQGAFSCGFAVLPSYGGQVGNVKATNILNNCLAETAARLNVSCDSACEGDLQQQACSALTQDFIFYADQNAECLAVATDCYAACREYDYQGYYDFRLTPGYACWTHGHTSDCNKFARSHFVCGGTALKTTGADRCYQQCKATEGAFDEGPFDGCEEACYEVCKSTVQECQYECTDDSACVVACLGRYDSARCSYLVD